jgi:hypothetical protein
MTPATGPAAAARTVIARAATPATGTTEEINP